MSWEDVDRSFDGSSPNDIVIHLDLKHFGELVGRVVSETHRVNGLEQFDPNSDEARVLVIDAWRYVCHMADRLEFEKSVSDDLKKLDAPPSNTSPPVTSPDVSPFGVTHLPEFGGVAPLPYAPDALNRRLEPPV